MTKSTFSDWTLTKLDKRFGLNQIPTHLVLDARLEPAEGNQFSDYEKTTLDILKQKATSDVDK